MTIIILASEVLAAGLNRTQLTAHLGVSRRTVMRCFQASAEHGTVAAFLAQYIKNKKNHGKDTYPFCGFLCTGVSQQVGSSQPQR